MEIDRIADDIVVFIGEAYRSSSTVFIAGDEALVIDAMGSPADAAALRRAIENDLGKRVRYLVATHYFSDHMAGLRSFPGATVIAHELYQHTFAGERHRSAEESSFFVRPEVTFSDRLTMRWGRCTLRMFHNPGASMSAIGIEVPEADLLFTANTIAGRLSYFVYGTPDLAVNAIERLRRCGRGRLLTGHDSAQDAAALDHALAYVRKLGEFASRCLAVGDEAALIAAPADDFLPPDPPPTEIERIYHGRNVEYLTTAGRFLFAHE